MGDTERLGIVGVEEGDGAGEEDIREGNGRMERKKIWEANQGNPASQICSCGIKIGIKTREQKYTSHFTSLLKGGGGRGGGRRKTCHSMLALIPQAQGVNSYSPHFTPSGAAVSGRE